MSKLQEMLALAAQAAEVSANMTEVVKGGGKARLLPAGYAFGRLVSVVEFGNQPQSYQGKAKDPKLECQLGFALWGEGYTNDDDTPYILYMYPFAIDQNEKAKAMLLFKALNWKGTATCFAQLLTEGFLVKIVHEAKSKADPTLVSRADPKGFLPPMDPVTKMPYPIPEVREEDLQLFLWRMPTMEGWNSLYAEGNYDDGKSKNFLQEKIIGATDFEGSALQALLVQSGAAIPKAAVQAAVPAALPTAPAVAAANPTPAPAVAPPVLPAVTSGQVVGIAASPALPPVVTPAMTSPSSAPALPALNLPKIG